MLVTLDVGNTNISLGIFQASRLVREARFPTRRRATAVQLARSLTGLAGVRRAARPWQGVVVASVVPEIDRALIAAARSVFQAPVLVVTPETPLPVKNGYHPRRAVGADRLVNAVAALAEFHAPVLIVDFGTATTVDAVSRDRVYLGGAILPGLMLSMEALAHGTSLLPRVELKTPRRVLGRSTEESLRSGVILGAAGAVSRLVREMRVELGPKTTVIATGGWARLLAPLCPEIQVLRPQLTLQGLRLCWQYAHPDGEK